MISLNNLLNKSRCVFTQVPVNLYSSEPSENKNYKVCSTDEYDEPIDHLYFREHFNENPSLLHELDMMNIIHGLSFEEGEEEEGEEGEEEEEEEDVKMVDAVTIKEMNYPIHPYVKSVKIMGRVYTAYQLDHQTVFVPSTIDQIELFLKMFLKSAKNIHETRHYISNVSPDLFIWNGVDIDTLTFSPLICQALKPAHFKERSSIIIGTNCISPYQIIWDMLHSKNESEILEYKEFKEKFSLFWEKIMKPEYKFVPKLCQKIYGEKTGLNYVDFILNRWCKIEKLTGSLMVERNVSKVRSSSFLYSIDYFGVAIQVIRYVELLKINKVACADYTPYIRDFLFDAITMNYSEVK